MAPALADAKAREQKAREEVALNLRKSKDARLWGNISFVGGTIFTAAISAGIAFPPALLLLPIMLPIVELTARSREEHYLQKAHGKCNDVTLLWLCESNSRILRT